MLNRIYLLPRRQQFLKDVMVYNFIVELQLFWSTVHNYFHNGTGTARISSNDKEGTSVPY